MFLLFNRVLLHSLSPLLIRFGLAANRVESDIGEMTHLNVYQASKRGGTMQVAVVKPDAAMTPARVVIAGKCRTIMQSTLIIPVE